MNKLKSYETLHVFGVGRKTVERGPGGGSRTSGAATTTAGSLIVDVDGLPEGDSIARRCRGHNTAQYHVSPFAAPSSTLWAVSHILVTTSGELNLLPVWERHPELNLGQWPAHEVQRFRHSAIVFVHFPGISYFPRPKWRLNLLPVPVLT